jgi:ferredoxin-type protein NapH
MATTTTKEASFWARHRTAILVLSLLLFLPPLAVLPQLSADSGFCGTWCPRMFWSWRKGENVSQFMVGIFRAWLGVALVIGILGATVLIGRQWCSHICPIGGSMELVSRLLPRRLHLSFRKVPAAPVRYGYLAVYILAPALGIGSLCCSYCNFASIPRFFGAAFSQADLAFFLRSAGVVELGLVVGLGFLARGGRAYCNFLCPIGALDALVSRLGARFGKRVRIDEKKCSQCGACADVCPTWAITTTGKIDVDQLSCLPCRECEKVCDNGAIRFDWPRS